MYMISLGSRQILRAVILAPLAIFPAMMLLVSGAFLATFLRTYEIPSNALSEYTAASVMALAGIVIGYAFTIFYGVPVFLFLKKIRMLNVTSIAVMSLVPAVVFGMTGTELMPFLLMSYFSLWVAITFWWIAAIHSPNSSNNSSNLTGAKNAPSS